MIIPKDRYVNVKTEMLNQLILTGKIDMTVLSINEEEAKKLMTNMKEFINNIQIAGAKNE